MEEIKVGLTFETQKVIAKPDLADAFGSGNLPVFATPCMITQMENTAMRAVAHLLPEGQTTVGTAVNIQHTAATKEGETVIVTAELIEINGRLLTFDLKASCNGKSIGHGTHTRAIIDSKRFMEKLG